MVGVFRGREKRVAFQSVRTSSLQCCVPLCRNTSRYNKEISFHIFPLNAELRARWKQKIRRQDLDVNGKTRVCGRHFKKADFKVATKDRKRLKRGAVPVLFSWNGYQVPPPRLGAWKRRPRTESPFPDSDSEIDTSSIVVPRDHTYCVFSGTGVRANDLAEERDALRGKSGELELQVEKLQVEKLHVEKMHVEKMQVEKLHVEKLHVEKMQVEKLHVEKLHVEKLHVENLHVEKMHLHQRFGLERLSASDEDIRFYTRFASYRHFMGFWKLIEPTVGTRMVRTTSAEAASGSCAVDHQTTKLQPIDELLLFLIHLAVGLPLQDLAERFSIHRTAAGRIVWTWVHFLYCLLGSKRLWIPPEVVRLHLPAEFAAYPDTQVVLDCTEIFCQTPSSLLLQSKVVSTDKSHTTFKAMIGMAPHGAITFVSGLYADSMSDGEIFKLSGITQLLKPGMAIMVDRGFVVDNLAPCKVYRPAFLSKNQQRSRDDVRQNQCSARLRVHVERCIRRVKENKLFDKAIPLSTCGNIEELFSVACFLVNYQTGPLVKAWATLN